MLTLLTSWCVSALYTSRIYSWDTPAFGTEIFPFTRNMLSAPGCMHDIREQNAIIRDRVFIFRRIEGIFLTPRRAAWRSLSLLFHICYFHSRVSPTRLHISTWKGDQYPTAPARGNTPLEPFLGLSKSRCTVRVW